MQTQSASVLTGYSEREKGAYLAALASLSTADRQASQEELDHLREVAHAAGLSPQQEKFILNSATDISGEELKKCLDVLKTSQLRYSLITDLIALAKADESYTEDEKENIEKIAKYLGVNNTQVDVLDEFVSKAAEKDPSPEQAQSSGFLDSLGMRDKLSKAGLNFGGGGGGGLMGMLGPMLLGGIAAKALGGRRRTGGGMLGGGGLGGGLLGGALGGMLGGGMGGLGGGLGSILGGMNRSRSSRGMGGLLGRIL
ncbi:MAG TPA: TerB family tellurite resistance protein [Chryseosolibacter sp.]